MGTLLFTRNAKFFYLSRLATYWLLFSGAWEYLCWIISVYLALASLIQPSGGNICWHPKLSVYQFQEEATHFFSVWLNLRDFTLHLNELADCSLYPNITMPGVICLNVNQLLATKLHRSETALFLLLNKLSQSCTSLRWYCCMGILLSKKRTSCRS